MRQLTPKPLFESSTVRGVTASALATIIIGILPFAQSIANRHCGADKNCQNDVNDIVQMISVVVTTISLGSAGYAVVGRASIGDLWTPRGVPGPNREELMQYSTEQSIDTEVSEVFEEREDLIRDQRTFDNPLEGIK